MLKPVAYHQMTGISLSFVSRRLLSMRRIPAPAKYATTLTHVEKMVSGSYPRKNKWYYRVSLRCSPVSYSSFIYFPFEIKCYCSVYHFILVVHFDNTYAIKMYKIHIKSSNQKNACLVQSPRTHLDINISSKPKPCNAIADM